MSGKTFVRRRGTTSVPNATVHDERLSYDALGILVVALSRPDTASQGYRSFMGKRKGVGQQSILRAFRELNAAGYRYQFKRHTGKKVVTDTVISETPMRPEEALEWHSKMAGTTIEKQPEVNPPLQENAMHQDSEAHDAHASSVPEAKVSLETSSQETGNAKASEPTDISPVLCRDCHRARPAHILSSSGLCPDCMPIAPVVDIGSGRAQVIAMLARRRGHLHPVQASTEAGDER